MTIIHRAHFDLFPKSHCFLKVRTGELDIKEANSLTENESGRSLSRVSRCSDSSPLKGPMWPSLVGSNLSQGFYQFTKLRLPLDFSFRRGTS